MTQHTTITNAQQSIVGLTSKLRRVCLRVRAVLILRSVFRACALILAVLLCLILADYLLRLPVALRLITAGGLLWIVWKCWTNMMAPAIGTRITPTDIALEIERQSPSLRGLVASAVDLQSTTPSDPTAAALTNAALNTISNRIKNQPLPTIIRLKDSLRSLVIFAIIVGISTGLSARSPSLAKTGISRILTPWTGASWPKRFVIHDITRATPHPIDIAVPVRATIGFADSSITANARAVVNWKILDQSGSTISNRSRSMLVPQHKRSDAGIPIYEQLIDVSASIPAQGQSSYILEYTIETSDDSTQTQRISLVRPPALLSTTIHIDLPAYAQPIANAELVRSGAVVSARSDSIISPILTGSSVTVNWQFSKPIADSDTTTPPWVSALSQNNQLVRFDHSAPDTITLELIAENSSTIEPSILDEMGISIRIPIVLSLGVLDDLNPGATITDPVRDETISTHAIVELQAELTDDLGLLSGSLHASVARKPTDSSGAPHEPVGPRILLVEKNIEYNQRTTLMHTLDISLLNASPGDDIWIMAIANDLRQSTANDSTGTTESPKRILHVVSDSDIIDQIRSSLNPIRNSMRQLDEQQASLQRKLQGNEAITSRDQRALVARLDANKRAIDQLSRSIARNTLDDPSLESLLNDASSILNEAGQAGERASDQIDRGDTDRAEDNQRIVRDRIGELLSMLDRGQDSWLALRAIEQLRDELEALHNDTTELNAQTAGQSLDQLSPDQKSALDRILERQLATANDARDAISTLEKQSEQLRENNPTQAEALSQAAKQGRSAQLEEKLNKAADLIESNQTSSAAKAQSEVLDELNEMLEELENTIKNRDNALRRELASIIDSLKAIITAQEHEFLRLNDADAIDLDQSMIALSRNTLAVRDQAMGAFPETRSIADLITQAANAQSNAISSLRQSPVEKADASRSEQASLLHLRSALEEAQRVDDQAADRQARQLRTKLRDQYREALTLQTILRDESALLIDQKLSRRQRASARALAISQSTLSDQLAQLIEQTDELAEAPIFNLAHNQLDSLMARSSTGLSEKTIQRRTVDIQNASTVILSSLVEVLSDTPSDDEPKDFDDGSQGGSGSGSGGQEEPVIPPVAQLKLLRTMQQLAAMQTREFAENPKSTNDADIQALSKLQSQLFEQGRALIKAMSNQPTPSAAPTPDSSTESPIQREEDSTP